VIPRVGPPDRLRRWRERIAPPSPGAVLIGLVVVAAALRLWILLLPEVGFANDLVLFTRWMHELAARGLAGFYATEDFCDYPPLFVLAFRAIGELVDALGRSEDPFAYHVATKLLASGADLATGVVLGLGTRRILGAGRAVVAAGLYLLNPVAIYDSAVWGQVDAVPALLLVLAVILADRNRWMGAGAAGGLALAAKFQSVAVLPLVALEVLRRGRGRGLAGAAAGAILAFATVATPFLATGTLEEVTRRAYVDVVGQYHRMSFNAFNLWMLGENAEASDTVPPMSLVRIAAGGAPSVEADASWFLALTWRRISIALFALAVASVLSVYLRRPGSVARFGAAGALALAFYLFPTEMHERYAFPAVALLAPWAASRIRNERLYLALTVTLLLNLVAVLPPDGLERPISAVNLILFGSLLAGLGLGSVLPRRDEDPPIAPAVDGEEDGDDRPSARTPVAIRRFQQLTGVAVAAAALLTLGVGIADRLVPTPRSPSSVWLSDLTPTSVRQGWGTLRADRSVSGSPLWLDGTFHLRGVGTHAPATIVYDIPSGATRFVARAGIDRACGGAGSAEVTIEVDGREAHHTGHLTPDRAVPVDVNVRGGATLTIRVGPTWDGNRFDHVDLAEARFVLGPEGIGGTVSGRPDEAPPAE